MSNWDLLAIAVCPLTKQELKRAPTHFLKLFNECIQKKLVRNKNGKQVLKPVQDLYLRADLKLGYVQIKKLPILIEDQAIELDYISNREWQEALKKLRG